MTKEAMANETIVLLSKREIEKMRQAGRLAAELLHYLEPLVQPGVTTLELDEAAERWTQDNGARSAPLGYCLLYTSPSPRDA